MRVLRNSLVIVILIIIISFIDLNTNNNKVKVTLDSCVDGDTVWFIVDGKREKVRLLGIDTPESTNIVEEYGKNASSYTCNKLKNARDIYLEFDINSDKYDKYDRLLAYIFVDDNNLGELLLLEGLAEVKYIYGKYKYINNFCNSQYKAYKDKLNIWKSYDYSINYCNDIKW